MLKFILGVVFGALMSFVYVHYNLQMPAALQLPDLLRGKLIATATEGALYDLDAGKQAQMRALEVYFDNRADDAARIDAAFGHPFLAALHRELASRQARQLSMAWQSFDQVLGQESLRTALEAKHGTSDGLRLKQAMLWDALERKPFLKRWLRSAHHSMSVETLPDILRRASAYPQVLKDEEG